MAINPNCISLNHNKYPTFMIQAISCLLICKIVYYALKPWIRSRVFCNILAGIILGPMVLGRSKIYMDMVFPDEENDIIVLDTLVKMGGGLLSFFSAVKFDAAMFFKTGKTVWIVIVPGFVTASMFYGYVLGILKQRNSGFLGKNFKLDIMSMGISTATFTTISEAMEEHNLLTTELGRLAISSAMVNELLRWNFTFLAVLVRLKTLLACVKALVSASFLLFFTFYVLRSVLLFKIRTTPDGSSADEGGVIRAFICATSMGFLTQYFVGMFSLGTFFVGLAIPKGHPLSNGIVEKSQVMIKEFFQPLGFLYVGCHVDVSLAFNDTKSFIVLVALNVGGHVSKILGVLLGSMFTKINFRNVVLLGFITNFKGILELFIYARWYANGEFDKRFYSTLVVSSMFLCALYDNLLYSLYKPHSRLIESDSGGKYFGSLISCSFAKELNILTCVHYEDNVRSIITMLGASNPTSVHVIHAMELSGQAAPSVTPYSSQKRRGKSKYIMKAFINYSRNTNGVVSMNRCTMVAPYKTMHNIICNYAEDKRTPFILVPFQEIQHDDNNHCHLIRIFNVHLQENAHSTVGILVDNGLSSQIELTNILVIFLGGQDDREALSLAIRMSANQDLRITILRIILEMDVLGEDNDFDHLLDDSLIKKFKESDHPNVVFNEVEVNNSLQLISIIESIEEDYDLIMVGKMPNNKQIIREMILSIEYQELGLIGDLIVSSSFNCSNASLLVMQHHWQFDQTFNVPTIKNV